MRHPRLPLGALGVVVPSALVYAAALAARTGLNLVPRQALRRSGPRELPVDMRKVGEALTKSVRVLLCSGSYVLCDVSVPTERLRVRVTLM